MERNFWILLILAQFCFTCPLPVSPGYQFQKPDASYVLPESLHEISGLSIIDSASVCCVQDENGILFIYDVNKKKMVSQVPFGPNGDYEGIARVDSNMYVLRSDGLLYEIRDFMGNNPETFSYDTGVPVSNNEGLCYDRGAHRLLIGCKSKLEGRENRDRRLVYAFDLDKKELAHTPLFDFRVSAVMDFARAHNVALPVRVTKKGKERVVRIRLSTSEIAIHPVTRELYVLSAADKMLFIFDPAGKLVHLEQLDPLLFNKPEGIAFYSNGDMLISNEGQQLSPTLLRFNYKS
jgi:hypothetical protein